MSAFLRFGLYLLIAFPLVFTTAFAQTPSTTEKSRKNNTRFERSEEFENLVERREWNELRLRDPQSGSIPDNIRAKELAFARSVPAYPPAGTSAKGNALQSPTSIQFNAIGPRNVGGRTLALAIDYTNPNVLLSGGATGGVWRSIDGGKSWTRVSPVHDIHHVSSIVQSLVNPKVWYMGTGEVLSTTERRTSTNIRTIATGTGIYRSTDGGVNWSLITPPIVNQQHNTLSAPAQGVWKLLCVKPADTVDAVYAALYGGVYVYLKNEWFPVVTNTAKSFSSDVVATPDAQTAYFALSSAEDGSKPEQYGIYRKEGSSYTNITPPDFPAQTRRIKLALAPSNKRILYVLTEAPPNWALRYKDFSTINTLWKYTAAASGNGGTWEQLMKKRWSQVDFTSLGGYALTLAVHPLRDSVVFMGGTNLFRTTTGFRDSTELEQIGGYPYVVEPGRLHPDMHNLVFAPNNPERLYVCCDGGVFYSDTCRTATPISWQSLNNGYHTTQCYHVAIDEQSPGDMFVMTGLQDNASYCTFSSEPDKDWIFVGGGDGSACQIAKDKRIIFGSLQFSNTYAFLFDDTQTPNYTNFESPTRNALPQFVTAILLEPLRQRSLFMPIAKSIYYYTDPLRALDTSLKHKDLWKNIAAVDTLLKNKSGIAISCMAASVAPADVLVFGTTDGDVYLVLNPLSTTAEVQKISGTNFPKGAFVSSIDIDPRDASNIVVSFSNYNTESIFYTTDGGSSWRSIAGNLENNPDGSGWGPSVRVVKILAQGSTTTFLAGTSTGVYSLRGEDATLSWTQEGVSTIGNLTVESIAYRQADGRIVIGTQGGGVYAGNINTATGVETEQEAVFQLEQNYPNPVSSRTSSSHIYFTLPTEGMVELELYDVQGKLIQPLLQRSFPAGRHSYELQAATLSKLADGAYFYSLRFGALSATRMISIER